ncbi:MAG: endonuclease/exonuclease/phosphatase family protein [Planctomycetes bacterium]|nr:endonuclease/exonuclease/phosphatase family protein [Planctomycetota bacterium]
MLHLRWLLVACLAALLAPPLEARDPPARLRVLQWNVGTIDPRAVRLPEAAIPRVVDTIAQAAPDVVVLQEVESAAQVSRLRRGLAARGLVYEARIEVAEASHPDGLIVHLVRRAHARRTFRTSTGYAAQAIDVGGVWVVGVHAPAAPGPQARATFFDEVLTWTARELRGPVILAGDFNLGPGGGAGTAALLPWQRRVDRATYARLAASFPVRTTEGPTTIYRMHLDHVMGRGGVRLARQEVLRGRRIGLMDHDAVLVDLQVGSARTAGGLAAAVTAAAR